jgi:hypothetical protein
MEIADSASVSAGAPERARALRISQYERYLQSMTFCSPFIIQRDHLRRWGEPVYDDWSVRH